MKDGIELSAFATDNDPRFDRFRELDTSLGRWTRQDPTGFIDGSNRYTAYQSSPKTFRDDTGLKSQDDPHGRFPQPIMPNENGVHTLPEVPSDEEIDLWKKNEGAKYGPCGEGKSKDIVERDEGWVHYYFSQQFSNVPCSTTGEKGVYDGLQTVRIRYSCTYTDKGGRPGGGTKTFKCKGKLY